jgi:hypothetical protein
VQLNERPSDYFKRKKREKRRKGMTRQQLIKELAEEQKKDRLSRRAN